MRVVNAPTDGIDGEGEQREEEQTGIHRDLRWYEKVKEGEVENEVVLWICWCG